MLQDFISHLSHKIDADLSSQTQSAYMAIGSLLRLSLPRPKIYFPTKCSHPQLHPRIHFPTELSPAIHNYAKEFTPQPNADVSGNQEVHSLHTRSGMHTHTKHLNGNYSLVPRRTSAPKSKLAEALQS